MNKDLVQKYMGLYVQRPETCPILVCYADQKKRMNVQCIRP